MRRLLTNFIDGLTGQPGELLVEDGRVGTPGEAPKVDVRGGWLYPAFVDAHCHILPCGLDLQKLHLGSCASQDDVLQAVRDRHVAQPDGWLLAVHYDQNRYEGGHLHRDQLDAISPTRPILLRHVSGHSSVANSAALAAAKVGEDAPDPAGGEYVRDASGRLTGLLLEHAHEIVTSAVPNPTLEEMTEAILLAGRRLRGWGIAAACDMMTGRFDLDLELRAYEAAAARGCQIDTVLFVQWREVFGRRGMGPAPFRERADALRGTRVGGIKIFADGAIGSATAAVYGSYTGADTAGAPRVSRHARAAAAPEGTEVSGQLIYSPDRLNEMVLTAHDAGFRVATHTIGDYATDLVMNAYEATGEPARHRVEHAMLLSDAQIERLRNLGCDVTLQPEFLMRFGHTYRRQLGPERSRLLKRTRSLLDAGIPLGFSSDLPIVNGDPQDGIRTAARRPEGFDPAENCTLEEAIRLYSAGAAAVSGMDGAGTLDLGAKAAFNVWEAPLNLETPVRLVKTDHDVEKLTN